MRRLDDEQRPWLPVIPRLGLLPPAVEGVQLAFQLFELLSRFTQFSLRGKTLIVFEISCGVVDERIEIV
jgi:hypothetical protein